MQEVYKAGIAVLLFQAKCVNHKSQQKCYSDLLEYRSLFVWVEGYHPLSYRYRFCLFELRASTRSLTDASFVCLV